MFMFRDATPAAMFGAHVIDDGTVFQQLAHGRKDATRFETSSSVE